MVADFLRDANRTRVPARVEPIRVTVVTGASFGAILKKTLERLALVKGLSIRTIIVKNRFFGPSVTVSGLLTGSDILEALKNRHLGDLVLLPSNVLKDDEQIFLDNMSLSHLEKTLGMKIRIAADFSSMVDILRGKGRRNDLR